MTRNLRIVLLLPLLLNSMPALAQNMDAGTCAKECIKRKGMTAPVLQGGGTIFEGRCICTMHGHMFLPLDVPNPEEAFQTCEEGCGNAVVPKSWGRHTCGREVSEDDIMRCLCGYGSNRFLCINRGSSEQLPLSECSERGVSNCGASKGPGENVSAPRRDTSDTPPPSESED
jgi:hypothetical protein